jgi:hypothetical protein
VKTACAYLDDLLGVVGETVAVPVLMPAVISAGAPAEGCLGDVPEARSICA